MRLLTKLILISFLLGACEKIVSMEDLEERNNVYYKKNSNTPFTGKIDGISFGVYTKGQMKGGKAEGEWYFYHSNGNLDRVGNFLNGLQNGKWYFYDTDANHLKTEIYKNGVLTKILSEEE